MNIGILGAGNIGANAARLFAKAGHDVRIANSRGPKSLASLVAEVGPKLAASTPEDAVAFGDLVLIAVPWSAAEEAIPEAGPYEDKIVVDAMNPYTADFEIEDLGDRTSSEITKTLVPGARLVKAFNTLFYRRLESEGTPGRLAIPVAGDDAAAKAVVMGLIDEIGFDPIDSGSLADGGRRQQPGTPVYNQAFSASEVKDALAKA
jgi:8-hydroxy-5-deazaflavin:NADPH oxidoreductase